MRRDTALPPPFRTIFNGRLSPKIIVTFTAGWKVLNLPRYHSNITTLYGKIVENFVFIDPKVSILKYLNFSNRKTITRTEPNQTEAEPKNLILDQNNMDVFVCILKQSHTMGDRNK